MDLMKEYLNRSAEIIGERTPDEELYDREVVRWLEKGKPIKKAIARANAKYPDEALQVVDDALDDLKSRYEYLVEHEGIMRRLRR